MLSVGPERALLLLLLLGGPTPITAKPDRYAGKLLSTSFQ
jgi:hypothetical protein